MLCGGSGHTTNTREGEMRGVDSIEKLTEIPIQSSRVQQEQNSMHTRQRQLCKRRLRCYATSYSDDACIQ